MTNIELANKALAIYNERSNWTYCQGALGQLAESTRVKNLYEYFRKVGGNTMTMDYPEWLAINRGKHCTDCSNFINYLLGYTTSMYSTEGYGAMPRVPYDKAKAPVGAVLYKQGHVGIVVGEDTFIDFYAYNNTCRKGKISESLFDYAVYVKGVDYVAAQPKSIDVKVHGEYTIGDTVPESAFEVTVTLSNGSKLKNPEGWQYTPRPLVLTNTDNVVACVYGGLVGYYNVKAKIKDTFYGVQIPAESKADALKMQAELVKAGYQAAAVVEMH